MNESLGKEFKCEWCGTLKFEYFSQRKGKRRFFCSKPCYMAYRYKYKNGRAYLTPDNPVFGKPLSEAMKAKRDVSIRRTWRIKGHPSAGKSRLDMVGSNNPNWKGGKSSPSYPENWQFIRQEVLRIHGANCFRCKRANTQLDIHHIVPWNFCQKDDIFNLIPLCRGCHFKIERATEKFMKTSNPVLGLNMLPQFWAAWAF